MKERVLYYNHPYKLQFTSCKKKVIKMDMYQKRKIRKEKRENSNQNEKFHKVVLNCLISFYLNFS